MARERPHVATLIAGEADRQRRFSAAKEEVGWLLDANSANMLRYENGPCATVVGARSTARRPSSWAG